MTVTVRDIIDGAYRKIGIVGESEPMTADQAALGLTAYNAMLHGWKLQGIDVEHVDATLDEPFGLAPQFRNGTIFLLARELAPDFLVQPTFNADDFLRGIQAAYSKVTELETPLTLRTLPSLRRWFA